MLLIDVEIRIDLQYKSHRVHKAFKPRNPESLKEYKRTVVGTRTDRCWGLSLFWGCNTDTVVCFDCCYPVWLVARVFSTQSAHHILSFDDSRPGHVTGFQSDIRELAHELTRIHTRTPTLTLIARKSSKAKLKTGHWRLIHAHTHTHTRTFACVFGHWHIDVAVVFFLL